MPRRTPRGVAADRGRAWQSGDGHRRRARRGTGLDGRQPRHGSRTRGCLLRATAPAAVGPGGRGLGVPDRLAHQRHPPAGRPPGSELGGLLAGLAGRGVAIRGLLWRSHRALVRFNQEANRVLSTLVNRAGGQLVADQRVRRFGSHHQKLLVVHRPNDPVRCIAFVGGIDLSRGRADTSDHHGDDDPVRIDPATGAGRPGMTCSWSWLARPSWTSTSPSGNAGRTAHPPTTATRCGPCGGSSAMSPDASGCCCGGRRHPRPAPMPCRCCAPTRPAAV